MTTSRRSFLELLAMAGGGMSFGNDSWHINFGRGKGSEKPTHLDPRRHRLYRPVPGALRAQSRPQGHGVQSRPHASRRIAERGRAVNRRP